MSNRASRRQRQPSRSQVVPRTPFEMVMGAREHIAQVDDAFALALAEVEALVVRRREVEEELRHAVDAARIVRHTWASLGAVLGLTGEGARARYGRR